MVLTNSVRTALITGGTSGVGLYIVKELAKKDYNVFFIGSNKEKGKQIETELKGTAKGEITFIPLDLSDLNAVSQFVKDFPGQTDHLDLLANVAGVILPKRQETKDGLEKTFTIGYLSPFILCNGLVPLLRKSGAARIVNVAGRPSWVLAAKPDFSDLQFAKNYKGTKAALTTLHCKTMFTQTLAEQLAPDHITANSFHPGMVRSGLTRNMPGALRFLVSLFSPLMNPTSPVAIEVCAAPELNGITGQFFEPGGRHPLTFDKASRDQLWKSTEEILKKVITA